MNINTNNTNTNAFKNNLKLKSNGENIFADKKVIKKQKKNENTKSLDKIITNDSNCKKIMENCITKNIQTTSPKYKNYSKNKKNNKGSLEKQGTNPNLFKSLNHEISNKRLEKEIKIDSSLRKSQDEEKNNI